MKARLSEEIRANGQRSMFVRLAPGRFILRTNAQPNAVYDAPPLRPPAPREKCLVVRREKVDEFVVGEGLIAGSRARSALADLLKPANCAYMDRLDAERADHVRQLLTYVIVRDGDRVLCYERGRYNRVEEFLRGALCIGFGGHVNEGDLTLHNRLSDQGLADNARRELQEELKLPASERARLILRDSLALVGVINDTSSPVGRRHLAAVFMFDITSPSTWRPQRGEKSIRNLRWVSLNSNVALERFEYWSQLCLRTYFRRLIVAQPSFRIRNSAAFKRLHTLCLVGQIGSGKTEAARVFVEEYNFAEVNSGRVLAAILGLPPVPQTSRAVFQLAAQVFIKSQYGPTRLGRALAEAASERSLALVDGVRHSATLAALKRFSRKGNVAVVFVHTPPDVAFRFYRGRTGTDGSTFSDFIRVREAEVESEVADMIGLADAVLYNWWGRGGFRSAIRLLMHNLRQRSKT